MQCLCVNSYQDVTSSSATVDRPCDCLRPKSPLCSCQHCQWYCANKRSTEASSAECISNTGYTERSVSHEGGSRVRTPGYVPKKTRWVFLGKPTLKNPVKKHGPKQANFDIILHSNKEILIFTRLKES